MSDKLPTEPGWYWATPLCGTFPNLEPAEEDRRIVQLVQTDEGLEMWEIGYSTPSDPINWCHWHGPIVENRNKHMITHPHGKCQFEGCQLDATTIACGRRSWTQVQREDGLGEPDEDALEDERRNPHHPKPGLYCETHTKAVLEERSPEYVTTCPNCTCQFGVG